MNSLNTIEYNPPGLRPAGRRTENRTLRITFVLLCAILPLWRSVWILPSLGTSVYYLGLGLLVVLTLLTHNCRVYWSVVWMLAWCAASILMNTFSGYFSPWSRLFSLTLVIAGAGPLFANRRLLGLRERAFTVMMWGFVAISVTSFVLYYVARPITMYQGFLFMGITSNSMLMSPVGAVGALFLLQWYMHRHRGLTRFRKVLVWIAFAMCLFSAILAGSRGAMISFMLAFLVWLWFYLRSTRRFIGILTLLVILVAATSPLWGNYTETLEMKMEASQKAGGLLSTRESIWDQRWEEFKENPVFGVGFSKVEKTTDDTDTSTLTSGRGIVEPGNGWLFALSSTGLLGFILLLWIYLTQAWKLFRVRTYESMLLLSVLVFIGCHSFAEGYLLSSGNLFCMLFWLCLGIAVCMPKPMSKRLRKISQHLSQ